MKKYGIFDEFILQSDRTGQMKCGGEGGWLLKLHEIGKHESDRL